MKPIFIQASTKACSFDHHICAPYFRRTFVLEHIPQTARICICGLGFYRLFVNGRELTKGFLAPYISNPDQLCYVDQYDAAPYLQTGKNVIAVLLGNGLYNNFGGKVWKFHQGRWVGPPRLALEFTAEGNGEALHFHADTRFRVHPSPITFDDYRMGEHYDARLEIPGWNLPELDDSGWAFAQAAEAPLGQLCDSKAESILAQRRIRPVAIWPEGNGWVYDFGENNTGLTQLCIRGEEGQTVTIRHGEYLHNGKFTIRNIIVQKPDITFYPEYAHKTVYTAKGTGTERYLPSFAYYGFRYAYVEGIRPEQATKELLTFVVLHSDLRRIGGFSCSDPDANRLMEMVERSDLSNFHYFPTDCPHREKNGWTGDARISAAHLTYLFDASKSYTQWLSSIRACQRQDGQLPGIVPTDSWGYSWGSGPAWDCVLIELPYQLYKKQGDLEVIRDNGRAIERYLDYAASRRNPDGTVSFGLGDWAPVGKYANEYDTPEAVTDTLTLMDAAAKAAEMFDAIAQPDPAKKARAFHAELYSAVRRELVDGTSGRMVCPTQTAQAMALYYGVFPAEEQPAAFAELIKRIEEKDGSFDGGMLELHTVFHVLARFGHAELAYRMIMKPDFPSYGYLLQQGETTLPEAFLEKDDPKHLDFSHNHHIFCDVARFFLEDIAGLTVTSHQSIRIDPHFVSALSWAEGWHNLPAGRVGVRWERRDRGILLQVTCPPTVQCDIAGNWAKADRQVLPNAEIGTQTFFVSQ